MLILQGIKKYATEKNLGVFGNSQFIEKRAKVN